MRVLVFSDMHGNAVALEAMLDDLQGETVDQMVCLGDAIQGGPQPSEVVSVLRQLGCPVVMGNADDWLLSGQDSGAETISEERLKKMEAVREWQLSRLSQDDVSFIGGFQPRVEIPLPNGQTLLCYHGSKKSFDHIILPTTPEEEVRGFLEPDPHTLYCGGHTHIQFVRHFGRSFHFNPGSVGLAYRHDQQDGAAFKLDPWAEYAVLSVEGRRVGLEFRRVLFDAEGLIEVYRVSGRPFAEDFFAQYAVP